MDAFIAENRTDGTVVIKAPDYPVVTIKKNSEYLFATPQEFFAFKPKVDILVGAGLLVVKTITAKQASSKATEEIEKRRDSVKNDHITASPAEQAFEARKIQVGPDAPATTLEEDQKAIKAEIKALRDEFKTATDKKRKDEIRDKVKGLQAKL